VHARLGKMIAEWKSVAAAVITKIGYVTYGEKIAALWKTESKGVISFR
jgi:hypothetical protein